MTRNMYSLTDLHSWRSEDTLSQNIPTISIVYFPDAGNSVWIVGNRYI